MDLQTLRKHVDVMLRVSTNFQNDKDMQKGISTIFGFFIDMYLACLQIYKRLAMLSTCKFACLQTCFHIIHSKIYYIMSLTIDSCNISLIFLLVGRAVPYFTTTFDRTILRNGGVSGPLFFQLDLLRNRFW